MSTTRMPALYLSHGALFLTLGAGEDELTGQRSMIDGYWYGMAKHSIQIG